MRLLNTLKIGCLALTLTVLSLDGMAASSAQTHKQTKAHTGKPGVKQSHTPKLSPSAVQHVVQRHWHTSTANTSKFKSSMTVKELKGRIHYASKSGNPWTTSKTNNQRRVLDYTFKKPIGQTQNGKKIKTLRVVKDQKSNQVVTAFPVGP